VVATTGAVALEAGAVWNCVVLDTADVAAPEDEATLLLAVAVTVCGAWLAEGAAD
jgi:hypothetical protein